jgi:hypothetical protein
MGMLYEQFDRICVCLAISLSALAASVVRTQVEVSQVLHLTMQVWTLGPPVPQGLFQRHAARHTSLRTFRTPKRY